MSYMESGPHYQPNIGKNTTKTALREVPMTSQAAPIQARPTAIGDAPVTTSVDNSHMTKNTIPVVVPKEVSHVDSKMEKCKRNTPFQVPLHHLLAVPHQTLLPFLMTPPFPKQQTPK